MFSWSPMAQQLSPGTKLIKGRSCLVFGFTVTVGMFTAVYVFQ